MSNSPLELKINNMREKHDDNAFSGLSRSLSDLVAGLKPGPPKPETCGASAALISKSAAETTREPDGSGPTLREAA